MGKLLLPVLLGSVVVVASGNLHVQAPAELFLRGLVSTDASEVRITFPPMDQECCGDRRNAKVGPAAGRSGRASTEANDGALRNPQHSIPRKITSIPPSAQTGRACTSFPTVPAASAATTSGSPPTIPRQASMNRRGTRPGSQLDWCREAR